MLRRPPLRIYHTYTVYLYLCVCSWPEPYICTVYDRIFSDFPAKSTLYTLYIYMVLANPIYIYIILATPTRDMSLPVVVGVYNMCAISAGHYNNADASHLNINPLACCGAWLKGKALVFINSVLVALPAFPPQSVTCSVRAPTAQH